MTIRANRTMSSAPDPTLYVGVCVNCPWTIDTTPSARRDFGIQGAFWEMAVACNEHRLEAHPDETPADGLGQDVVMGSGESATGAMVMHPLPRWWSWFNVKGSR